MMRDFERALRKLHNAGRKRFGEDWIPKLERRRVKLEGAYATLYEQDRDPIAYGSLSAQTAYVFAYAPVRAEYTKQYLSRHRAVLGRPLFGSSSVKIVSFGGGPASELVGLVRFLEEDEVEVVDTIEYVVYDKDGDWAEVANDVITNLQTDIKIDMNYVEVNAASRKLMSDIDLSQTDMVIFSYIMSELARLGRKDQIAENFRGMLGRLKVGAKILFMDNLHPIFIEYFQACKLVSRLNQRNDDDAAVFCPNEDMPDTFKFLSDALDWTPRTELRSISKLIVRTAA